jgi:hypothetical protein
VAFLVRIGLSRSFRRYELPALGLVAALLLFYPLAGAPTGFAATLIVSGLIAGRSGFRRSSTASSPVNMGFAVPYEFKDRKRRIPEVP